MNLQVTPMDKRNWKTLDEVMAEESWWFRFRVWLAGFRIRRKIRNGAIKITDSDACYECLAPIEWNDDAGVCIQCGGRNRRLQLNPAESPPSDASSFRIWLSVFHDRNGGRCAMDKVKLSPVEALRREIDDAHQTRSMNWHVYLAALELAKADAVLHEFNVNAERFGETLYGPHKDAEKSVLDARTRLYEALKS
jgi:hypothetical protein